jgi:hypothetical protein
MAILDL